MLMFDATRGPACATPCHAPLRRHKITRQRMRAMRKDADMPRALRQRRPLRGVVAIRMRFTSICDTFYVLR